MTKNKSVPIWIVRGKQYGVLKIKLVGKFKISDINSNFKMIYLTLVEHKTHTMHSYSFPDVRHFSRNLVTLFLQ